MAKMSGKRQVFFIYETALHDHNAPALEAAFQTDLAGVDHVSHDVRAKLFIPCELGDRGNEFS